MSGTVYQDPKLRQKTRNSSRILVDLIAFLMCFSFATTLSNEVEHIVELYLLHIALLFDPLFLLILFLFRETVYNIHLLFSFSRYTF